MMLKYLLFLKFSELANGLPGNFSRQLYWPVSTRPLLSSWATGSLARSYYALSSTPFLQGNDHPPPTWCVILLDSSRTERTSTPHRDPSPPVSSPATPPGLYSWCSGDPQTQKFLVQFWVSQPRSAVRGRTLLFLPKLFKVSTDPTLLRPAAP